jgi:hypothetical protein
MKRADGGGLPSGRLSVFEKPRRGEGTPPPSTLFSEELNVTKPDDTLLVMCRSGGRSAMAVNLLAKAGFKDVYNITDGMEGVTVEDTDSVFYGMRMKNGWKNSGCPWTYNLTPDRMVLPKVQ